MIHHKATKKKIAFAKRLRRRLTRGEQAFKKIAKDLETRHGHKFWSQVVLFGWIVDFWCPKLKLIVEIDGASHDGRKAYDENRSNVLCDELDAKTVRFTNFDVINNPAIVRSKMRRLIKQQLNG